MNQHDATEQAYKRGYEDGKRDASKHGDCVWCKPGEERCGTCRLFFDYYGDGGSDSCSSDCDSKKCAYYEPIGFCPNCGRKLRKEDGK